ncbi:MAG: serine hydrolase domain-containing protein [Planctomycetaceae bacterium]
MVSQPDFSRLADVIQQGIERLLHTGVQVYVSVWNETVLDQGFGMAGLDQPMTSDTIMLWRSAGKPLTAAAVCRAWQQSRLDLDAPLAAILPDIADSPLSELTVRQMLTHSTGLALRESGWPHHPWPRIIETVLAINDRSPAPAYQPQNTWFLLGEILQQLDDDQRPFADILKHDVLLPLEMEDTHCGIPDDHTLSHRLSTMYSRDAGKLVLSVYSNGPWLHRPSPGGNLRGPVRSLGRFYEMLLNDGVTRSGQTFLQKETVQHMTSRHRVGEFDQTFQHPIDFGLGLIMDSNVYGVETVPYGFSPHCSPRTFGHGGSQCAMGFCDPDRGLVAAWAANGFCGEGQHQRRNRAINAAIYEAVVT